jgi:hypothetical protein
MLAYKHLKEVRLDPKTKQVGKEVNSFKIREEEKFYMFLSLEETKK